MSKRSAAAAALVCATWATGVTTAAAALDCSHTDATTGAVYDLSALSGHELKYTDSGGTAYHLNPCSTVEPCIPSDADVGQQPGTAVQWVQDEASNCYTLATWDSTGVWTVNKQGVQIVFNNGDDCNGVPRKLTLQVNCAAGDTAAESFTATDHGGTCNYSMSLSANAGCAAGSGGWSFGDKFCLWFPLGMFLYFVIGFAINVKALGGEMAKESLPNYAFWSDLPGLVSDGCKFVAQKIQEYRAKSGAEPGVPSDDTMNDALTGADAIGHEITSESAGGYGSGSQADTGLDKANYIPPPDAEPTAAAAPIMSSDDF